MDWRKKLVKRAERIRKLEKQIEDERKARNMEISQAIHWDNPRERLTEREAAQAADVSYAYAGRCARYNGEPPSGNAIKRAA